jgi:excisionase family DNA binding protein
MPDTTTDPAPRWIRRPEAARFLGISLRRLDDLLAEGAIPTYRPTPGRVLVAETDLVAHLRARRDPRRGGQS